MQCCLLLLLRLIPVTVSALALIGSALEFLYSFVEPNYSNVSFDYVIVGGGSAGCVLANRLSEDPKVNVLLVEAGGAPSFVTGIPALATYLQLSPYDWQYETVPQESACLAMKDRKCKWPRGKMLGGSSNLNYMMYTRGSKGDYDEWSKIVGDSRWSYEKLLPYFKKAEATSSKYAEDISVHGRSGPLSVRDSIFLSPLAPIYKAMAMRNGLEVNDPNDGDPLGFDSPQVTVDNSGTRADTYRSYLLPAQDRKNLYVVKHAHVTRVLIDQDTKAAHGVEFVRYGNLKTVEAKREVILSAGAIGSPKILLHSGVGPSDHLSQFDIAVVKDLPVGNNLHDHIATSLGPFVVNQPVLFDIIRSMSLSVAWDYLSGGKGPLAATVACDAMGFLRTNLSDPLPNIQYLVTAAPLHGDYGTFSRHTVGLTLDFWKAFVEPHYGKDAANVLPVVLHPKSRGTLRLQSSDPFDPPILDPKYFSHPEDVDTLVEAIQIIIHMLTSDPELRSGYDFQLSDLPIPGCENELPMYSNRYWSCYVRQLSMTVYHTVGTCSMGSNESNSVVNSELKVHGVRNLRVVDASIMPKIVSGNTNAPVIAIAELASDIIKNSNRPTAATLSDGEECHHDNCYDKDEL